MNDQLDIGCGPNKRAGFDGIDIYPYVGVDIVHDLDAEGPWPIGANRYRYVRASHVIEHIRDLKKFFQEVHRISMHRAVIRVETPHFSSYDSWRDPTHLHHLSVDFCEPFLKHYLRDQIPSFELISKEIKFDWRRIFRWPPQLCVALFGHRGYERHFAWIFPATEVIVELRVVK